MSYVSRSATRLPAWAFLVLASVTSLTAQSPQAPALELPRQLEFAHQTGTAAPAPQTFRVYSNPDEVAFTASVRTQSGGNWLFVNDGASQYTGNTGIAGQQDLVISVDPTRVTTSTQFTFMGTVTITSGSTAREIGVSLSVSMLPALRLNPASIVALPVEQLRRITVPVIVTSSDSTQIQYSAHDVFPSSAQLSVSNNLTDQETHISILPFDFPGQTVVNTVLRFAPSSMFSFPVTLPVSLKITPAAQLAISSETVDFPRGSDVSGLLTRKVIVTSTTENQLAYTATISPASPWLTLSTADQPTPGSTSVKAATPDPFYLIVDARLTGSASEATVRIETPSGNSVRTLMVRLMTSSQPQLTLTQEGGLFSYTRGSAAPPQQTVRIGSTGAPQQFRSSAEGDWFTVSPSSGTTPEIVTISVNPVRLAEMSAGTYAGNIQFASATSQIEVPVRLTVREPVALTTEPAALEPFTGMQGQRISPRFLIIRSTGAKDQSFNVGVEYGSGASGWLFVSKRLGNTGSAGDLVLVNVDPGRISSPGLYEATIVVAPGGSPSDTSPVRIPVRYTVTGLATVTVSPGRIELTQQGSIPPPSQTIQLTGATPTLRFSASVTQPWLRLIVPDGRIPGFFTVTFSGSLPGDYTDTITIRIFSDTGLVQTITIPVTLRVLAAVQGAPGNVALAALPGTSVPVTRTLSLTAWSGPLTYTAVAISQLNWLTVFPTSGIIADASGAATPLTISANPSGLTEGTYTGSVTLNTPGGATPKTIAVRLTVSTQPAPANLTIANAATGMSNGVSPGLIVTIRGRNMAPARGMLAMVTNGVVQSTLGEVRVLFDELPAPLLYVGPSGDGQGDQINAIVPYVVGNPLITRMVVEYRGVQSAPVDVRVEDSDFGLFTVNQSGSGQVAALNQDGTVNSVTNPAEQGSIIQLFGTGEGRVFPDGADGQVITAAADIRRPVQPLSAYIANQTAQVTYAGSAPTLVSGVVQVNVRIPNLTASGTPAGPLQILIGRSRQLSATVAVR